MEPADRQAPPPASGPATLRVGVEVQCCVDDAGEYLADAKALEAAGADSIWVDRAAGDSGHDPWMLLAAIAAVTDRVRLGLRLVPADAGDRKALAQRLTTLERVSRGRITITVEAGDETDYRAAARLVDGIVHGPAAPAAVQATFRRFLESSLHERGEGGRELWARVGMPDTRDAWRATLRACGDAGATGVLVPFGPRLLDLLRRPDEEDDRSDLLVAQG